MKKKLVLILVLVSLVLIGCNQGGQATGKSFAGGQDGLEISFVEDEPPVEILDAGQQEFFIALKLENKGEYNIPKGGVIASLKGISKDAFNLKSLSAVLQNELLGKRKSREEVVSGDTDELRFPEAKYAPDLETDFETSIRADVCYTYRTNAVATACFKKDAAKKEKGDACFVDNRDVKFEDSSAPIKLEGVDETPAGAKEIKFTFKIKNQGAGSVYDPDAFTNECKEFSSKKNRVKVKLSSPTLNLPFKCGLLGDSNEGMVKLLEDGTKTVSCKVSTSSLQESAFETLINIQLDYFYKESLAKPITIKNAF